MKTVSVGTNARRQLASLAAGARWSPACPSLLLLLLLLELVLESTAESPWALPVVADRPASLAKVVMAELANLKSENKPWPGGTHSLRYHYLTLSEPGPGLPQFLAVGYVDDQPFIRYDSRAGRAEPQAPWMASMDTQYWETETQKHRTWAEVQQVNLWTVMSYYNQSGGIHSAHRMFGCDIQEDSLSSSFWHFGFDGQDHLSLDLETLSWVSAEPVAMQTKRLWDSERCYAEYDKAYLESLCLTSLHRYLELGSQILTRKEPPTVQVTRHTTQDRSTTLRCWALGFYPQDISLSWWLEPPSSQGLIAMVTCPLLFLLVIGVVILTRRCLQGRNKEPYEQAPERNPYNSQSPARTEATQLFC
ncbi:class I histocompatibility antigen, Gogo-C*0203 alpha chain-like isoform 4-T4 [Glossophaga mutica]